MDKELILDYVVNERLKSLILKGMTNEEEAREVLEEYRNIVRYRIDDELLKANDLNDRRIKLFTLACAETDKQLFECTAEGKYSYLILSKFRDKIVDIREQSRSFARDRYNNGTIIDCEKVKEITERFMEAAMPLIKRADWTSFVEDLKTQLIENLDYASGKTDQFQIQIINEM